MKEYGRIRYIDCYDEAPEDSYVIREMGDLTVQLEHYYPRNNMDLLAVFPESSFFFPNVEATLVKARKIMGNRRILWVEKSWGIEEFFGLKKHRD